MPYSLDLRVFRFNVQTDFLPYYTPISLKIDKSATLLDLLKSAKNKIKDLKFDSNVHLGVKVNSVITMLDTTIREIIEFFETNELIIEPIDEFRAIHDLIIDFSDFYEKMAILSPYFQEEDKKLYDELISCYYASPALQYERDYLGDSFFLFANTLTNKYPEHKEKILKIVANENYGIWLHTPLKNLLLDSEIANFVEKNITQLKQDVLKLIPNFNRATKQELKRSKNFFI